VLFAALVGGAAPLRAAPDFNSEVRSILAARCVECHGPDEANADVNFASLTDAAAAARQRKLWRKALAQIEAGDMPPADATPLTSDEKQRLVTWMKHAIETVDCSDAASRDPGPTLIRRLSLAEYNRTIEDLLGFEFDAAATVGMTADAREGNAFGNLAAALDVPPAQMEKYFSAADLILDRFFGTELSSTVDGRIVEQARTSREQLFSVRSGEWRRADYTVAPPANMDARDAALAIITKIARRAYRGQATPTDIDLLMSLYDRAIELDKSYGDAVRLMLKAVLVSPKFLYRIEQDPTDARPGQVLPVSDHELATRLSYFLWSSMPDDELLALADDQRLTTDKSVLQQQVRRMLADPRAKSLTNNFALHWLQVHRLPTARPSTEFFPEFNANIRQAMLDETAMFFDSLRTEDRSVLELLDADYTFANEELARYYGLPAVQGKEMQRVALEPSHRRGGLLGMGSVLAITSHTSRTSPTMRGKWILEVIFGTPPPPPPANVSQIKEDDRDRRSEAQTFREKLAQHAHDASCAGCHRKMDPLGFSLDNYDAVGRWREKVGDLPIDATGELPTGETLRGVDDLKRVMLARKADFARNMSEQLLVYALGRELDDGDECAVREIVARLEAEDYRFSALVLAIAESYPLQFRRATGEE
jgi:cytochrome c553